MTKYCQDYNIIHEVTALYTPQSNGVVKRKNRILMNMVNCMLLSSGAPENIWGEALLSTCYILNRVPQRGSNVTLNERWKGRTPNSQFFKVWGCLAKISIPEHFKTVVVFIGYALDSNIGRFLVVNSEISEISNNTIIEVRNIVYLETSFLSNLESLLTLLVFLLPLIFLHLILLHLLT